jgi:hypothetical protein
MDTPRLRPSVELPLRRGRLQLAGVAGLGLALLVSTGARTYLAGARHHAIVRLDFVSEPSGATVVREIDHRPLCVTPCSVGVEASPSSAAFRYTLDGFVDTYVRVNLAGGDTHVEALLTPERRLTVAPRSR